MKQNNRSFGILFFIIFLIISIYLNNFDNTLTLLSLLLSFIFLVLGILNSKILGPMKKIWIKLGDILGLIISPIVMLFIYFSVIFLTGIILKILRKDILNLKIYSNQDSYWINRNQTNQSMDKPLNSR